MKTVCIKMRYSIEPRDSIYVEGYGFLSFARNKGKSLTLFRMGGGVDKKGTSTSFSPVTSTNVGIRFQNFLSFSFNPFDRLVQNFKFVPIASPKLLNLNQDHSSKKAVLLVKSL